ncbi:MAG: inositol monophosphatase family protein [Candidatus Hodarchaeota archaeon]
MKPDIFISSSFHTNDEPVLNSIKRILDGLGIPYYQAHVVPDIPDSIIAQISQHNLFMAILTKEDSGQLSPSVSFEIGVAITLKKHLIILREDTVNVQSMYSNKLQTPFNREALTKNDKNEVSRIINSIKELYGYYGFDLTDIDPKVQQRYDFARGQVQLLGSTILAFFNDVMYRNTVRDKAVKNFPTEADRRANRIIVGAIQDEVLTRDDGIISEESIGDIVKVRKIINEHEFVWIIDPLDGTLNFAYGFPFFCVSIGLLRRKEPIMGVLFNPTTQELFCGLSGRPSMCFDLKTGSKCNMVLDSAKTDLEDCIVMTHLSSHKEPRLRTINILDQLMESCRSVRMLGSGQLALIALSLGQFDIFYNFQTNIWDIVPGYVIIKGAGGFVSSTLSGPPRWSWKSKGVVAALNASIGNQITKLIHTKLKCDFPQYC